MLWLLNRPGAMAITTNSATISPPAMAEAFGRGQPLRTSIGSSASIATELMGDLLSSLHAGVKQRVQQVNQEVEHDEDHGHHQGDAHDRVIVQGLEGLVGVQPDA